VIKTSTLIGFIILMTPFSYVEVEGVRLIIFQVLAASILFVQETCKQTKSISIPKHAAITIFLAALLCAYITISCAITSNFKNFLSVSIFMIFMWWSFFIDTKKVDVAKIIFYYKVSVVSLAIFLIIEIILEKYFGYSMTFTQTQEFGENRTAHASIWKDYSFLSLYFASAIPLFYKSTRKYFSPSLSLILILIFSSITTSARTGISAFIIFYSLFLVLNFHKKIFFVFKNILMLLMALIFSPLILKETTGRNLTIDSSGRVDDIITGWNFFVDNYIFGYFFDDEFYLQVVTAIPHNLFVYHLYAGGIIGFILFSLWMIFLIFVIRQSDKNILSALIIAFIGFQLIPSFFSSYFFAILLSIAILSSRKNSIHRNRNV